MSDCACTGHTYLRRCGRLRYLIGRSSLAQGPEVVPLKLSVCECSLSANVSLSTNAMGKSKDKQAKEVKAAKPSTKSTKPALDPALSSLFASSVRAELLWWYAR